MAKANDIGIIPWGALAEGFLTGKVSITSANQSLSFSMEGLGVDPHPPNHITAQERPTNRHQARGILGAPLW
jgi:aryl-alcohol dehydrogenase-like predicted oxidoreductase